MPVNVKVSVAFVLTVPAVCVIAEDVGAVIPSTVYDFPAILTCPPCFNPFTVNVAVSPLSTKVPAKPASCAASFSVFVPPSESPFNR